MNRRRIRILVVVVPALLVGAVFGGWLGTRLFPLPGSAADVPAAAGPQIEVRLDVPGATDAAPDLSTPAPSSSAAAGTSPAAPGQPQPGNPGGANTPQPPSPPTGATTTAPPPPTWGPQLNTSLQVTASYPTGGTVQVGRAEGWFQMHNDRKTFRYSFTFCRQSSYMLPYMAVAVNGRYVGQTWQSTPITTIYPGFSGNSSAQPCYGATATVSNEHSYPTIQNVYFKLHGSTFLGSEHAVFSQDRTFYNSN